jgi:hypothetical protein
MIRKHFKLRRIVLGLALVAFVAFVAPAAYAKTYVGGPTSEIQSGTTHRPFASEISVQPTVSALQADGMRWQAMADAYLSQSPVRSENSFGAPGPSTAGATGPQLVTYVNRSPSNGFDWTDASVGAGVTFGMTLLLLTAIGLGRRNRSRLASA